MEKKMHTRKVVIVGAGRVGSHCALCLMFRHLVNQIVLIDVNREAAEAQAMDLQNLASGLGESFTIRAGDYSDCADAHFVIMTAGRSRKPGQTRLEMLGATMQVLGGIVPQIRDSGFGGILISVTNPSDIVAEYLYRTMKLPRGHVFGTGTALDSARLRGIIGREIGVDSRQVNAFCMGEHGDSSFIPTSHISVGGIQLREYLSMRKDGGETQLDFDAIKKQVKEAGSRIVKGKGCTEFGIASIVSQIIMSILHNERAVIPLSAHLEGEYGESGISIGVPCILSDQGVEQVLEIDLTYDERRAMRKSCDIVRENLDKVFPEG